MEVLINIIINNVISILSDNDGNLIDNTNAGQLFQIALNKINVNFYEKKLLANMLDKNYTVCRYPLRLKEKHLSHWVFELWKIDNNIKLNENCKSIIIKPKLKRIDSFSAFEQEVIYALLSGYVVDKEIELFLRTITREHPRGNVRYAISILYQKFNCESRTTLVCALRAHGLSAFLPKTIFPCGEYTLNS